MPALCPQCNLPSFPLVWPYLSSFKVEAGMWTLTTLHSAIIKPVPKPASSLTYYGGHSKLQIFGPSSEPVDAGTRILQCCTQEEFHCFWGSLTSSGTSYYHAFKRTTFFFFSYSFVTRASHYFSCWSETQYVTPSAEINDGSRHSQIKRTTF